MADPVVSTLATGTSTTATTTVSFSAQASGTLLLLSVSADDYRTTSGSGRPESTGWTLITSGQDFLGAYLWYKFATGSETSVQYTIGSASRSTYAAIAATNVVNVAPGTSTSLHTHGGNPVGTTAITPASGRRFVVASINVTTASATAITGFGAMANSYTTQATSLSAATPWESVALGYLTLDGGTSTSTSVSSTGNSGQCSYGLLTSFEVSSSGTGATVNAVAMTATTSMPIPVVIGDATVTAVSTAATATALVPTVSDGSGTGATVNAVTATSSAAAPLPVVSGGATVAAIKATATGAAPVPAISGETVVSGGGPATATAQMLIPSVTASSMGEVAAVRAQATATALAPGVTGGALVAAVAATGTGVALPPTVGVSASVIAVRAIGSATALVPSVAGGAGGGTVLAVPATALIVPRTPTVTGQQHATVTAVRAIATITARVPVVGSAAPTYRFSPPTYEAGIYTNVEPLNHFRLTYAASIVRVNGTLTEVFAPNTDLLTQAGVDGVDYFLGGRDYEVTEEVRTELLAAGYTVT